jgi:hypothetical protein
MYMYISQYMWLLSYRVMVRLGEFDTEQNPDCETDLFSGAETCAPLPQDLGAQRIIVHPEYEARSISRFNDIGLVRLDGEVQFNGKCRHISQHFFIQLKGCNVEQDGQIRVVRSDER